MRKAIPHSVIIDRFINVHGGIYDYSMVEYVNMRTKVVIICSKHGAFKQEPRHHLDGHGCVECGKERSATLQPSRKSSSDIIEEFRNIHGDRYDYSKVKYINNKRPVLITCEEHGDFSQYPSSHIHGYGCPECTKTNMSKLKTKSTDEVVSEFISIHGDKYDYSCVEYKGAHSPVIIYCKDHDTYFECYPSNHKAGAGCRECGSEKISKSHKRDNDWFINESIAIFGDIYDYSQSEYTGYYNMVAVRCKKHGFFLKRAYSILKGYGCPECTSEDRGWNKSWFESSCDGMAKLYVIKCYNDSECFYKIGITGKPVRKRFHGGDMPYSYDLVAEINGDPSYIWDLEKEAHRHHKKFKYSPCIKFGGHTECFNRVDMSYIKNISA